MRLVTALKAVLQANMAMQAFMQRGLFIGEMLEWAGRRWPFAVYDEIGWWKRLNASHSGAEFGLQRIEVGFMFDCPGFGGREIPVFRKSSLRRRFSLSRLSFADRLPAWRRRFGLVQLNAIDRRQWLDIGHFRLEGSKIFRVNHIQASASR